MLVLGLVVMFYRPTNSS